MKKLPTLSDGKSRYVTAKQWARLDVMAKAVGKCLREWLELGGAEKGKL